MQTIDWSQRLVFKDESKLISKLVLSSLAFVLFLVLPWRCQLWLSCCDSQFKVNFEAKTNYNVVWLGNVVCFFYLFCLSTAQQKRNWEEQIRQHILNLRTCDFKFPTAFFGKLWSHPWMHRINYGTDDSLAP